MPLRDRPTRVLHLTAHMGGGVGKAVSGLIEQARVADSGVRHLVVCLEEPRKNEFIDHARRQGAEVVVRPQAESLRELVEDADILQLEWWNHPATIECLCSLAGVPMRLLTWCHTSGLHNPIIPRGLISASRAFIFTSACSLEAAEVVSLPPEVRQRCDIVSSSGGFRGLPEPGEQDDRDVAVGYFGSLNFAKLHPRFVEYVAAVEAPDFRIRMIGDAGNQDVLSQQCAAHGREGLLEFRGYSSDAASELAAVNVLAYLLNPEHYGTTENALLEAMATGIVPIVLDNRAERQIVEDRGTGLVVHSPAEFAEAIRWLSDHPSERHRLGVQAAESVRHRFAVEKTEAALRSHYGEVLATEKDRPGFREIFGADPAEWFLSCQPDKTIFGEDGSIRLAGGTAGYGLMEATKGTVFHFSDYFPAEPRLQSWAGSLRSLR